MSLLLLRIVWVVRHQRRGKDFVLVVVLVVIRLHLGRAFQLCFVLEPVQSRATPNRQYLRREDEDEDDGQAHDKASSNAEGNRTTPERVPDTLQVWITYGLHYRNITENTLFRECISDRIEWKLRSNVSSTSRNFFG